MALAALESHLAQALTDTRATPRIEVIGAVVLNECSTLAEASLGAYVRANASSPSPAANPPGQLRWLWASVTKTLVGVVMQLLMANSSLPTLSWYDRLDQWLPSASGTDFENATLLDVASHTACLHPEGAPLTQAFWTQYYQLNYEQGYIAGHEYWAETILQYGALSNCTPNLNTVHNYVHVDGVILLALIEERLTGLDFSTLAKTLIFDPLQLSTAEVQYANPAGGLVASLQDVATYGQWLVQGYHGRPEALARTLLQRQDFVDLLSPIWKHGVLQPTGRTFGHQLLGERLRVGHGGCTGAQFHMWPWESLIQVAAVYPEDAGWGNGCDEMVHVQEVLWATHNDIAETFTACGRKPSAHCGVGVPLSCEITAALDLDESSLDTAHKKSACEEEALPDHIKEGLKLYRASVVQTKAFVISDNCWAYSMWMGGDVCSSMTESLKHCRQWGDCSVFLVGNESYTGDWPCRCGVSVLNPSCAIVGTTSCGFNVSMPEVNTSCLIRSDETTSTSVTSSTSAAFDTTEMSTALSTAGFDTTTETALPTQASGENATGTVTVSTTSSLGSLPGLSSASEGRRLRLIMPIAFLTGGLF